MNSKAAVQRVAATIGAAAVLGLASTGPANARQDPGEPIQEHFRTNITMPYDQGVYERHYGTTSGTPDVTPVTRILRVDDNALEYFQIGLGALGGLALAGAAARVGGTRHRHQQAI